MAGKNVALSISDKVTILDRLKKGEKRDKILSEKKLSLRTLQRIVKDETQIRRDAASMSPSRKRKRTGRYQDIDDAMEKWFASKRAQKKNVTGSEILKTAQSFAKEFGIHPYVPTFGWLGRWKKRLGICYKKAHGEKGSANTEAAEQWIQNRMPEILLQYDEENIFNADETGLFYRAILDGTLCFKNETLSGSKKAMDRITVLVCSNMAGTEKKKLLEIHVQNKLKYDTGRTGCVWAVRQTREVTQFMLPVLPACLGYIP